MSTKTIEQFFTGKSLEIPPYQRAYAWKTDNVDDLFEDILEAMEMGGGHYLGTFILSAGETKDRFKVVDGQQRLTTLTMLLDVMVDALPDGDLKTYYRSTFLCHPVLGPKISMLGNNQMFFTALLGKTNPCPVSEGQKRMKAAYDWIQKRVQEIKTSEGVTAIQKWLLGIGNLEVLEFIEPNEGKAIRMFQSVNDRGVPLSRMDIAKSLLIYYSNRFLNGELDHFISDRFGNAFQDYSIIKSLSAEDGYKIRLIDRNTFKEDDVFRYHYFAYNADDLGVNISFDYNATSETILEAFLKPTLKQLRSDTGKLKALIENYVTDLANFFQTLRKIIEDTRTDKALYLLFVVGDLSATLYPLIIRLVVRNALREPLASGGQLTLLQVIEIADLRVFKLRGTNPQVDIFSLTRQAASKPIQEIASDLRRFVGKFMDDGLFESRVSQENLYRNPGLLRIFCAVEEKQRFDMNKLAFSLTDLVELVKSGQTTEHILPQEPSFGIRAYGFRSKEEYMENIHRIGNLTLLESNVNSLCSNQSVEIKVDNERFYRASSYQMTQSLAAHGATRTPAFSLDDINSRGAELAKFCVQQWPLW